MAEYTDTERLDQLERLIILQGWESVGGWVQSIREHRTMRALLDSVLGPIADPQIR